MEKKSLEELLHSIDRPGDFFAHGRLLVPMPVLKVDSVGVLSFPVPDVQIRALVEMAELAPYGKGTETLVDTSVRDCWQVDAARVHLGGRAWPETFSGILGATADGLGAPSNGWTRNSTNCLSTRQEGSFRLTATPRKRTE